MQNPESRTSLPGIAFGDFGRRFSEPSLDEGFKDIIRVQFQFEGGDQARKVWSQYWIWFVFITMLLCIPHLYEASVQ